MQKENKTRNVEIDYTVNAPRNLVFEAWTNPAYMKQWFAPNGCTIEFKKLEIKEGGRFHSCIHNPQFGDCWCIGIYKEIKEPERIVYTMINADEKGDPIDPAVIGMDPAWPGESLVTVTFSEMNGKTTIHLKQDVSEILAKKTGAYPSWIQMLEHLEQLVYQKK